MSKLSRRKLLGSVATTAAWVPLAQAIASDDTERPSAHKIWDAHGHLAGLQGTPAERVDFILQHADRMGVERLMLCMGLKLNPDPSPDQLIADNDAVLDAIQYAPKRTFGFVYLNPKYAVASLNELDRCVKNGPMVGVKLWIALRCNHPDLDAIVHRASQLGVPILQHVYDRTQENKPGESLSSDLSELAARHPAATFIAAHAGNDWEQGIREIRKNENVYAEICGSDATAGIVEMAVRELGAERVIYGSDLPGRSLASQIGKVTGANLSDADKSMILKGNLKHMLTPLLQARGVL